MVRGKGRKEKKEKGSFGKYKNKKPDLEFIQVRLFIFFVQKLRLFDLSFGYNLWQKSFLTFVQKLRLKTFDQTFDQNL